jgi:hypothetical protein
LLGGGHRDYSRRAPKDLATQLSTILRKSQSSFVPNLLFVVFIYAFDLNERTTRYDFHVSVCLISQRSVPTVSVNAPRGLQCRNLTVCKQPKQLSQSLHILRAYVTTFNELSIA